MTHVAYTVFDAPLGQVFAGETRKGLLAVTFGSDGLTRLTAFARRWLSDVQVIPSLLDSTAAFAAYLDGSARELKTPLDLRGTPFQIKVWEYLLEIPYGETRTYGEVAAAIGQPAASRAVGAACGANPVPLAVPCHRVLAADGGLGGYTPGLEWKKWLLSLEGCL